MVEYYETQLLKLVAINSVNCLAQSEKLCCKLAEKNLYSVSLFGGYCDSASCLTIV